MASRHSRLALKGNTYTQIGLKVWYASERSGRRRRGVGDKGERRRFRLRQGGGGRGDEGMRHDNVCGHTYACSRSAVCRMRTYTRKSVHTRIRAYISIDSPPAHLHKVIHWRSWRVQCAQPLRTRESLQKCSTHFKTNHCQPYCSGDKFN